MGDVAAAEEAARNLVLACSLARSHAIPTVGPDCRVRVHLAGDDADVEVVLRAPRLLGALAQAAHAHLVRARSRHVLADAEQPARLFPLAPDLLKREAKDKRFANRSRWNVGRSLVGFGRMG